MSMTNPPNALEKTPNKALTFTKLKDHENSVDTELNNWGAPFLEGKTQGRQVRYTWLICCE